MDEDNYILIIAACYVPIDCRYAFNEDIGDDLDEESIALTGGNQKPALVEPPKDKKSVNTDVFSLDDELEEGKLE